MSNNTIETERCVDGRVVEVADRPIRFDDFLPMAEGRYVELVDGVIVEKSMVQMDHERCSGWLYRVIGAYIEEHDLGELFNSRTMIKADEFGGRMPGLLFVRQDRHEIVKQKAVYGAPDLVIEVRSPGDRPAGLRALEADYVRLGVPEIVFIDLKKHAIRVLRKSDEMYGEDIVTSGQIEFKSIEGLALDVAWILEDPRPKAQSVIKDILSV
jgi:Uma2 family endonuclease